MANGKLLVLIAATAIMISAGEFRTRFNKAESVSLVIPRPADAVVNAKSLAIQSKQGPSAFRRSVELEQFIQQDLAKEYDLSKNKPEATLQFSVVAYEPVLTSNETKTEMRSINVGTSQKPTYQVRSVPVVYRVFHGSITGSVFMFDKNGKALDSYQPVAKVVKTNELTVNGQAPQAQQKWNDLNPLKSFRKPPPTSNEPEPVIETPEGLETQMLQKLASEIQKRYVATSDTVSIFLAVDSELRLGDKLAESGQWKEALDAWTNASMRKNAGDRMYNMAVAKEALAYAEYGRDGSLDEFLPKFQEAMDLYTNALHADPAEKYMRQAVDRLQLAKADIEATRRMKVDQDATLARAARQVVENAQRQKLMNAALADKSPDTPDEASFRANVRAELSAITGDVTDAKRDELVAFGERLKLPNMRSYRVVSQEMNRKKMLGQALSDYERVLKPLASDGKITSAERAQLQDLARREDLDTDNVKSVESKYTFEETSRSGNGKVRRPATSKSRRPAAPAVAASSSSGVNK